MQKSPGAPAAVTVRLLDAPYTADAAYTYSLPEHLRAQVFPGSFVTVPFGGGNRRRGAVVTGFADGEAASAADKNGRPVKLKPVLSVTQERFPLSGEQLGLCSFLCDTTLCTYGEAVHTILPAAAFSAMTEIYLRAEPAETSEPAKKAEPPELSARELELLSLIADAGETGAEKEKLCRALGDGTEELLAKMRAKGLIRRDFSVQEPKNDKKIKVYSLAVSEEEASRIASGESGRLRSEGQRRIVGYILTYGSCDRETLQKQARAAQTQLKSLVEKGILAVTEQEEYRNPYLSRTASPRDGNILSQEQTAAYSQLEGLYESGEPKAALLFGVTGSGKTRVMKSMVDRVLSDGRKVMILVPEISLTPQTADIFCGYYGSRVAVIHSSLSAGERYDAYKRIRAGEADVVIGTRSAVFAPLENLGLIVIDEEQEHTYKSDTSPKYHARDVARWRAAKNRALLLLASATPSLESYHKAKTGKYSLVKLCSRYGGAQLPQVSVIDMRREGRDGNLSPVSEKLLSAIAGAKAAGQQSILFLNRRGYNHFAICRTCGKVVECPHCSVSLTYHTKGGEGKVGEDAASRARAGYLLCHYCGYRRDVPLLCPECGSPHVVFLGCGTQRVEKELCEALPSLSVLRMDNDTTQKKFSYENLLGSFRRREADLLLGTQMVTKGHDFPAVTVVGVLDADSALHVDDYRAGERTFSLITQVIGRAGRGDDPGIALIQTHLPDNETVQLACRQDYEAFYEREIVLREKYLFPPFCDIVLLSMSSEDETALHLLSSEVSGRISELVNGEFSDTPIVAYGPFESPIYRMGNRYRLRMVFKCRLSARSRALFAALLRRERQEAKNVTLSVDFNPSGI